MIRTKIRKVNPGRSNRMIYAVAGGVAVILLLFFTSVIIVGGRSSGKGSLAKALAYLKNTEGLLAVQTMEAEKRAVIVFNSDSKNAGNFEKVAYYAALRLARHWPDCEVQLAKNTAGQIVYSVRVQNGVIAGEGPVTPGTDRP
jgi:hypothetical protein